MGRVFARLLVPFFLSTLLAVVLGTQSGWAQDSEPTQSLFNPGEAYVTRFSGTKTEGGRTVIDPAGTVGGIVDIRQPGEPAKGQHWLNEPQRLPLTAADVGQVFGIALDDADPPNIYLTATSAFGLHRTSNNADWMAGQWGPQGGPGTVWKLSADNGYKPEVFADITLNGRANSGPALGNIAYDKWNKQLYVSDLETGMIHRLRLSDGQDLGQFDHGTQGRANYISALTGAQETLPKVAFDSKTKAQATKCPGGAFAQTPQCWNLADFRRRVWGLGLRRDEITEDVRLYYAVWSGQAFGNRDWAKSPKDQRNTVWSVAIASDGGFDSANVRREFFLPDFFVRAIDLKRAGLSQPVTDIAFPKIGEQTTMLVAERGGVRNLGLDKDEPFASPHESRVLRYELGTNGVWQFRGRYDVGFNDRKAKGQPFLRAGAAGGVDFGYGYTEKGEIDTSDPNALAWMTGDALCSPKAPCVTPSSGKNDDVSEVSGLQGTPIDASGELAPAGATKAYPATGSPYPASGPSGSYMVDIDINVDAGGNSKAEEVARNDSTKIGDVAVYQTAAPEGTPQGWMPPGWTPDDWTAPDGYTPSDEWTPPADWTPAPDWTPPGNWTPPPWWVVPPWFQPGGPQPEVRDLEVTKQGDAFCATGPGTSCTSRVTIRNGGNVPYVGPLAFTDTVPAGAVLLSSGPAPWVCAQAAAGAPVTCNHPGGVLAPNASVTVTIVMELPAGGAAVTFQNCAEVDWPQSPGWGGPDTNPGNDRACFTSQILASVIPPVPTLPTPTDLQIEKTGDPHCQLGGNCSYQVTITNVGPGIYTGNLSFTDSLPAGSTFVSASPTPPWNCVQDGDNLFCESFSWMAAGQQFVLNPGDATTVTIIVQWPGAVAAGITQLNNCAEISWPLATNNTLSSAWVAIVEFILNAGGFLAPGDVDGIFDPATTAPALSAWQAANGLPVTGTIDAATLGVMIPGLTPASGVWNGNDTNAANDGPVCVSTPIQQPAPPGGFQPFSVNIGAHLNLSGSGPAICVPPNCTYYEFPITNSGGANYVEPMSLQIEIPAGSELVEAKGAQSSKQCSAGTWTCSKQGQGALCKPSSCWLAPGEQTAIGVEVRLAPGLTEPPPERITKTVCGVLEWFARRKAGSDIEQTGGRKHITRACVTTTIEPQCTGGRVKTGPFCLCPKGRRWDPKRKRCIELEPPAHQCAGGQVARGGVCVCPAGQLWTGEKCVGAEPPPVADPVPPPACTGGKVRVRGQCMCPRGTNDVRGRCVPIQTAPPPCTGGKVRVRGQCVCPRGTQDVRGRCTRVAPPPPPCTGGKVRVRGRCVCPRGTQDVRGRCTRIPPPPPRCTGGKVSVRGQCVCPRGTQDIRGRCVRPPPPCTGGKVRVNGRCVCPRGTQDIRGRCVRPPAPCTGGKIRVGNQCVCPRGTKDVRGRCVRIPPPPPSCTGGKVRVGNRCVCPRGTQDVRGRCVRIPPPPPKVQQPPKLQMIPGQVICPRGQKYVGGRCLPVVQ